MENSFSGTIIPGTTTDNIVFTSANGKAEVTNYSVDKASGIFTAIVTGIENGRDTITLTCGNYSDTISVLVMDEDYYTEVILAENYDPDGANFS